MHVLDHPVWTALNGPQAPLAEVRGQARRFPPDMTPLAAVEPGSAAYDDLHALVGAGGGLGLFMPELAEPGPGWRTMQVFAVRQMVMAHATPGGRAEPAVIELGPADLPEMLDLVRRTQPGPFGPRTPELGLYLGLRVSGLLVAMAGERLSPPGFVEVSAVCTDPDFRGRGFAGQLVRAVAQGIQERGATPFLHVLASNVGAISLYKSLGFVTRRELTVSVLVAEG